MSIPPPPPFLSVTRLTQGFILVVEGQEAIACSHSRSLVATIRAVLSRIDLGESIPVRPQTRRTPPQHQNAEDGRNGHAPLRANGQDAEDLADLMTEGNPELAQQNLLQLCEALASEQITQADWERGLLMYCTGISRREALMTLSSMTGVPIEPPRTRLGSDPGDAEKIARRQARVASGGGLPAGGGRARATASVTPVTSVTVSGQPDDDTGPVPPGVGLFDGDDESSILELLDPPDPTPDEDEDEYAPPDPGTPERERS